MLFKFNASSFYHLVTVMNRAHSAMKGRDEKEVSSQDRKNAPKILLELKSLCRELGAPVTELALADLISALRRRKPVTYKKFSENLTVIGDTLRRELSLVHLFILEKSAQDYFEPSSPLFGKDFAIKFPSAVYELDEAAKCIALSRPTASVFHLMRIMEIALYAVSKCLHIPDPVKPGNRNWGSMLQQIKAGVDARKLHGWSAPTDQAFFEGCYASIDAIRVSWRNATMHVENKYDLEEAGHIFTAVRGFMKMLISRCDETGSPHA